MRGDVHRIVRVIALALHHRDHHRSHRRHVGHGRARHAAEQRACHDVGHTQPPAHVPHQRLGERDDAVGNAAVQHEFAREDEEGNGQERERVHAGGHLLERHRQRQVLDHDGGDGRQADGEGHRHADHQEPHERWR
ncbi:hypothetical protein G6F22_019548 [Rhizopus arrhizus]|nr:hypothetical protein G6F22_019548 [Rhizopus arrhizus]